MIAKNPVTFDLERQTNVNIEADDSKNDKYTELEERWKGMKKPRSQEKICIKQEKFEACSSNFIPFVF